MRIFGIFRKKEIFLSTVSAPSARDASCRRRAGRRGDKDCTLSATRMTDTYDLVPDGDGAIGSVASSMPKSFQNLQEIHRF